MDAESVAWRKRQNRLARVDRWIWPVQTLFSDREARKAGGQKEQSLAVPRICFQSGFPKCSGVACIIFKIGIFGRGNSAQKFRADVVDSLRRGSVSSPYRVRGRPGRATWPSCHHQALCHSPPGTRIPGCHSPLRLPGQTWKSSSSFLAMRQNP